MRILITGANGFFGRNLRRQWKDQHELLLTDLPPDLFDIETKEPFDRPADNWFHCDLRDSAYVVNDHLKDIDVIVHLAAKTRIDPSWNEFDSYYDTNITASQTLFRLAQANGVKKFIYFSSSSVYGNSKNKTQCETDLLSPTNPYAVSKMAAEMALGVQTLKGDTQLIVVRPFTMYGDFMSYGTYSLAVAKFLTACERKQPIIIEGGGTQVRDFVHASDAIAALELIVEHGQAGDVYNIGTGSTVSVKTLADIVSDQQVQAPARLGAVKRTCADISRLQVLGYKPKVKIKEWLTERVKDIKLNETQQ
jgi:UDP-glucose 4-epimerase